MPHSRARKRERERQRIAAIKAAERPDGFFYTGVDCSCGAPLYIWAVSHSPKDPPVQLSGWIPIIPKSCWGKRLVTAHTADDAAKALEGKPVIHDCYVHVGKTFAPRLAHGKPSGAVLVADFTQMGSFGRGLRDAFLQDIFAECRIEQSILKLGDQLWQLLPGDFFIGHLGSMVPNGIWLDDQAVSFIEQLEDYLLPKGAKAILVMTIPFGQPVHDTVELCLGRIRLYDETPIMNMPKLIAEMRSC